MAPARMFCTETTDAKAEEVVDPNDRVAMLYTCNVCKQRNAAQFYKQSYLKGTRVHTHSVGVSLQK